MKVVAVINPRNFGEQGQVRGVAKALGVGFEEISSENSDAIWHAITGPQTILITSGKNGMEIINSLDGHPDTAFIYLARA